MQLEVVDDYTVRFNFATPYPSIINVLGYEARMYRRIPFAPKHYLTQFHAKYNKDVAKLAKGEGFENWWQLFSHHYPDEVQQRLDVNVPTVDAWTMTEMDNIGNKYFGRNPYYYKIDTAGNQLPYIDRQDRLFFEGGDLVNLAAIAGGLDYAQQSLITDNYTLYKENAAKGEYKAMMWNDGRGGVPMDLRPNLNHKDPVMRTLFNDLRFRQALSVAINRDEINEVVYRGLAVPRAGTVRPDVSFYEDWMGKHYAQFDPKMANKLLDEIGLEWDSAKKFRLRPDGKPLILTMNYVDFEGARTRISELTKEYWENVGLRTVMKKAEQSLYWTQNEAGLHDFINWNLDGTGEVGFHANARSFRPYAADWSLWDSSKGAQGEEPPDDVKRFFQLCDALQREMMGSQEFQRIGKEIVKLSTGNLWHIGTVGIVPKPTILKLALKNTPEKGTRVYQGYRFWMIYDPDQWYYQE